MRVSTREALGAHLPCIGRVFRIFNPKEPNYDDPFITPYISQIGDSIDNYRDYSIVPKRLIIAEKALLRYDRPPHPFDSEVERLYQIAGEWLDIHFAAYLGNSRLSSYDEVLSHLPQNKSPGYPWTLKYPTKNDYWLSSDASFQDLYWDRLATADPIRTLCSVSIKEEMRPTAKVEANNCRTIVSMDVNHVVAHLRLCLDQNERMIRTNLQHDVALGMDLLNGGMHLLNQKMSCFGPSPNTLERDGEKFDGTFYFYCMLQIAAFRIRMLAPEFRTVDNCVRMFNLYSDLAHAPFVNVDGHVYAREVGNPSGQGCTTPDNSLKNKLDSIVKWLLVTPPEFHTYDKYCDHLRHCIVGDDINDTVHPTVQQYWNPANIKSVAKRIGVSYHFPSDVFRHNYECTFLGHSFVMNYEKWGPAMWLPSIDCHKMRSSMLIYNEQMTLSNTIVRVCGLRNETWACHDCRTWFQGIFDYLKEHYFSSGTPEIKRAFSGYKTDMELWELYTGRKAYSASADNDLADKTIPSTHFCPYKSSISYHYRVPQCYTMSAASNYNLPLRLQNQIANAAKQQYAKRKRKSASAAIAVAVAPKTGRGKKRRSRPMWQAKKSVAKSGVPRPLTKYNLALSEAQVAVNGWKKCIENPFENPPVVLGDSGVKSYLWESVAKYSFSPNAASPNYLIFGNINSPAAAGGAYICQYANTNTQTLITPTTYTPINWANTTEALAVIGGYRPVAYGMNVVIRQPTTTKPPKLFAGLLPNPTPFQNGPTAVAWGTTTTLDSLDTKPITIDKPGLAIQSCWIPCDVADISSSLAVANSVVTSTPYLCVTGADTSATVDITIVYYTQCTSNAAASSYGFSAPMVRYTVNEFWDAYINSGRMQNCVTNQVGRHRAKSGVFGGDVNRNEKKPVVVNPQNSSNAPVVSETEQQEINATGVQPTWGDWARSGVYMTAAGLANRYVSRYMTSSILPGGNYQGSYPMGPSVAAALVGRDEKSHGPDENIYKLIVSLENLGFTDLATELADSDDPKALLLEITRDDDLHQENLVSEPESPNLSKSTASLLSTLTGKLGSEGAIKALRDRL